MMNSASTGAVFLLNLIVTIWATQTFETANGSGTLIQGECTKTRKASTWIHLAINILSTVLLSASNYCMQILTAPTRAEVDRAHASGRWLDIGTPSVRNLRWISRRRVWIWCCLALSSLPLHLLYNSAVYESLTANEYNLWTALEPSSSWNSSDAASAKLVQLAQANELERLESKACIQAYGRDFVSDRRDLVLIVSNLSAPLFLRSTQYPLDDPYNWICTAEKFQPENLYFTPCDLNPVIANVDRWTYNPYPYGVTVANNTTTYIEYGTNTHIEYCYSQRTTEHCQLQFSIKIMVVVIIANFLKLLCMSYTVWSHKIPTLVTVGDAISSFLQEPDPATVGRCTLSKRDFDKDGKRSKWVSDKRNGRNGSYQSVPSQPEPWKEQRCRWLQAASKTRWSVCYFW